MALDRARQPSPLGGSLLRRATARAVRGELVWTKELSAIATIASAAPAAPAPALDEARQVPPQPPHPPSSAEDLVLTEIVKLRSAALGHLDAELRARRAELEKALERERTGSEERIATAERLQREALQRGWEEMDHCRERMAAEEQRTFARRIEAALSVELGDLKQRYQQTESRMLQELEARRREEAARLEAWRVSERQRIAAELATEEERFSERLQRQLKDFEWQLDERQREQEERIARWYEETGRLARQRVAAMLDEALRPATSRVALSAALQPLDSNAVPRARAAGEQEGRGGPREVDGAPNGDAPPARAGVPQRLGQVAIG